MSMHWWDLNVVVKLLDTYLAKLSPNSAFFYMRPLESIPCHDSKPWYTNQRVGVNKLKTILPMLSSESDCGVKYTNHSLRATSTTRMFSKGVPEKLIEKTGHRSLKALQFYECTNQMERALSEVIADPTKEFPVGEKPAPITTGTADKCVKKETDTPTTTETPDKCVKKGTSSTGHSFSGNLTNCTINISYN